MSCSCCSDSGINMQGIELTEKEIFPFVKKEILCLRYPTHPIPIRYEGLMESLFAYGQALNYDRKHGIKNSIYYTENK